MCVVPNGGKRHGKGPRRGLEGSGTQRAVGRRWQAAGGRMLGPDPLPSGGSRWRPALPPAGWEQGGGGEGAGRGRRPGGGVPAPKPQPAPGSPAGPEGGGWGPGGGRAPQRPARTPPPPATPLPHSAGHSRFCSARGRCAVVKARKDSLPMSQSSKPGTWPWRLAQRSRCWSFRSTFRERRGRPAGGGRLGDTEAEASHHFLKAPGSGSDPVSWRQLRCEESPI